MPRTTRAAQRSKELAEESATAASVPLPPTPQKERVPLGEIADNKGAGLILIDSAEQEPIKQGTKQGRKPKVAKKGNKKTKNDVEEPEVEVLEDGNQSSASSAVEEARECLQDMKIDRRPMIAIADEGPQAPTPPAANTATDQLSLTPTLQVNTDISDPSDMIQEVEKKDADASCGTEVETRTTDVLADVSPDQAHTLSDDAKEEDSFAEQIKTRSPAKRISRIEDSVEALDALEEEIEKASQAIPATEETIKAPSTAKSTSKGATKTKEKVANGATEVKKATPDLTRSTPTSNTPVKKALAPKTSSRPNAAVVKKPKETRASLLRQGITPAPTARSRASPVVTSLKPRAAPAKRVSSVHKLPFQPTKSAKPPTQATFVLPGEAISRKLKGQREERLKREEEEKAKKQSFKARPVRLSSAPEVKMTAATKARLSMAKAPSNASQPGASVTRPSPATRPPPMSSSVSSSSTNKRLSSLAVSKRDTAVLANSTAKRAPSKNPSHGSRQSSVPAEPRGPPTAEDAAQQKLKGKECFARPKNQIAERERVRKEKEEAAKRARLEAAERGRVASREWAERQKAKKVAETTAKQAAGA